MGGERGRSREQRTGPNLPAGGPTALQECRVERLAVLLIRPSGTRRATRFALCSGSLGTFYARYPWDTLESTTRRSLCRIMRFGGKGKAKKGAISRWKNNLLMYRPSNLSWRCALRGSTAASLHSLACRSPRLKKT